MFISNIRFFNCAIIISVLLTFSIQSFAQQNIQTPEEFFGFKPGTDRMLFTYEEMITYFQKLDNASPNLKMLEIGKTPMGKPMYIAFISSADNISNLEKLKNINKELALNPLLSESEREKYFAEGKVFFLGTLSMHSSEVGPSQAAPLIAYELITSKD
ncbi:MAG: M14 family zinc carboxypeptidase, partial [Ignavibacteria bacterium]|nr:M14 family zinc carboxypeptidase [Ignavibacteria bacterium]